MISLARTSALLSRAYAALIPKQSWPSHITTFSFSASLDAGAQHFAAEEAAAAQHAPLPPLSARDPSDALALPPLPPLSACDLSDALALLAACAPRREQPDDVLSQRGWPTLFCARPWWPALRAAPPEALTRAWRAACALELDAAARAPLAEEAAQRGANESDALRLAHWGDARDGGSLAAAAAAAFARHMLPFLEMMRGRGVNERRLHGGFEQMNDCLNCPLSLDQDDWWQCDCAEHLGAGLASWGAPALPPSLFEKALRAAKKKAAEPSHATCARDAVSNGIQHSVGANDTVEAAAILMAAGGGGAERLPPMQPRDARAAEVVSATPADEALSAQPAVGTAATPAPPSDETAATVQDAAASAAPEGGGAISDAAIVDEEDDGDDHIALGWSIALGARGLLLGGLRSIPWLAAFGHADAAERELRQYQRGEEEGDQSELLDEEYDIFDEFVACVALTGSVSRTMESIDAVLRVMPRKHFNPPMPDAASRAKQRREVTLSALPEAGRAGHVLLCESLAAHGGLNNLYGREYEDATRYAISEALIGGVIPVLEFFLEHEIRVWASPLHDFAMSFTSQLAEIDSATGTYTYLHDDFYILAPGVLQWAIDKGLGPHFDRDVFIAAAFVGDIDGLKAVLMQGGRFLAEFPALPVIVAQAARSGQLELLEWLEENGAPIGASAFLAAVVEGSDSVSALSFLVHAIPRPLPLTVDEQAKIVASCFSKMDGHVPYRISEKVALLRDAGFAWDDRTWRSVEEPRYPPNKETPWQIMLGSLKLLIAEGCPRGDGVMQSNILIELIQRICEQEAGSTTDPVGDAEVAIAECITTLLDAGFPASAGAFTQACAFSPPESTTCWQNAAILGVLVARGCPRDVEAATTAAAAQASPGSRWRSPRSESCSISLLEWLEARGLLALTASTAAAAVSRICPKLLAWLSSRACPLDTAFSVAAMRVGATLCQDIYTVSDGRSVPWPSEAHEAAELDFVDAVLALRPPLDASVARAAAARRARGAGAAHIGVQLLQRLRAAGCPFDALCVFDARAEPPFLARGRVWRWLVDDGGVSASLDGLGAAACAAFEARARRLRRATSGRVAQRARLGAGLRAHRAWLAARGCGCGGALHGGAAPAADAACYICVEPLLPLPAGAPPLVDCDACAAFLHRHCLDAWIAASTAGGARAHCAHCRAPWVPGEGWPPQDPAEVSLPTDTTVDDELLLD
jgi:hypothetical protein